MTSQSERKCRSGAKFISYKLALAGAEQALKNHKAMVEPYKCRDVTCPYWHLTSMESK